MIDEDYMPERKSIGWEEISKITGSSESELHTQDEREGRGGATGETSGLQIGGVIYKSAEQARMRYLAGTNQEKTDQN